MQRYLDVCVWSGTTTMRLTHTSVCRLEKAYIHANRVKRSAVDVVSNDWNDIRYRIVSQNISSVRLEIIRFSHCYSEYKKKYLAGLVTQLNKSSYSLWVRVHNSTHCLLALRIQIFPFLERATKESLNLNIYRRKQV